MRERPYFTKYEKIKSYILLKSFTEKVFIGIFSFSGSKRMGKYCARIFSYFLGHPNTYARKRRKELIIYNIQMKESAKR
jgi:hypothetical protein